MKEEEVVSHLISRERFCIIEYNEVLNYYNDKLIV